MTVTANSYTRPYNTGNPNPLTVVYSGFLGTDDAADDADFTPPGVTTGAVTNSPVGNYAITVSGGFAQNYNFAFVSGNLQIVKATPVVTWNNPAGITYGTALGPTQLNATANTTGNFVYHYTPANGILPAGTRTISVDFNPQDVDNYNPVIGQTVTINVAKATPIITWPNPAQITYGTSLAATYMTATANTGGAFTYDPVPTTILNAGPGQTLTIDFAPSDPDNWNSVDDVTRTITVNKATPTVTWSNRRRSRMVHHWVRRS